MERRLTISILNTETRSGGLFRRSYTVILTQVYLIEALIDYSSSYKVYKRYSEFSLFALSLMPRIKKHHIALPNFPEKNLNNGTKTITIRKEMLQNWLQNISNHCVLEKRLCKFLQVDYKLILTKRPHLAIDDYYVLEYLQKIKKEQGKKLSILKDFSEKFLCRRRSLQNETMKKLISSILPLCAEEVISGFALDFITKISTREYFLEYEKIKNELVRMPMEEIRGMHLENFFLGKKFTQGQLQAYNLVCLLMEMSPKDIRENEDFYGKVTEMVILT